MKTTNMAETKNIDLKIYDQKIEKAKDEEFNLVVIRSEEEEKNAIDLANRLNVLLKAIEEKEDSVLKPLKLAQANFKEMFDPRKKQVKGFIESLKSKVLDYKQWARAKAEAEKEKIEKKADEGKLKPETALRKLGEVKEVQNTTKTESGKMSIKKRNVLKITNIDLIPRNFLLPDDVRIKKALEAGIDVPGATLEVVESMSF